MSNPLADDLNHILSKTGDLWEELRGKRIFITGGTGFFGCWLLESFLWANRVHNLSAQACVLTRRPEVFQKRCPHLADDSSITLHKGDVGDFQFPRGSFPFVIHAATEANAILNENYPLRTLDTIIQGTRRTLDFACQAGTKKFLLTSSGAVYGKQPSRMRHMPEDYVGAPDTMDPHLIYGEGKRCAELLCATYSKNYNIKMKIARCFAFVGPYLPLDLHFAIGNFIRDGLQGGIINVNGDGTPHRSYMYSADLMVWLWTILFRGDSCVPYNVGSDESISISDTAHRVARCFKNNVRVTIKNKAIPGKPVDRYVPEITSARSRLDLQIGYALHTSILKTIKWHSARNEPSQL